MRPRRARFPSVRRRAPVAQDRKQPIAECISGVAVMRLAMVVRTERDDALRIVPTALTQWNDMMSLDIDRAVDHPESLGAAEFAPSASAGQRRSPHAGVAFEYVSGPLPARGRSGVEQGKRELIGEAHAQRTPRQGMSAACPIIFRECPGLGVQFAKPDLRWLGSGFAFQSPISRVDDHSDGEVLLRRNLERFIEPLSSLVPYWF